MIEEEVPSDVEARPRASARGAEIGALVGAVIGMVVLRYLERRGTFNGGVGVAAYLLVAAVVALPCSALGFAVQVLRTAATEDTKRDGG